jgi:DNA-binding HxlR family transcriptional regulator
MRTYGQYCGLAKALDVIGERWALLIVRELLIRGRCRYTDLRYGLPGIATNLLASRLKDLEAAGVIGREEAPPPIATTLYRLTPRGEQLEAIVRQLGCWGAPLLAAAPKTDSFLVHWLALPIRYFLSDHAPERPPIALELRTGAARMVVETTDGAARLRPSSVEKPDAIMTGRARLVAAVLLGHTNFEEARSAGLKYEGDLEVLNRIQPLAKSKSASSRSRL